MQVNEVSPEEMAKMRQKVQPVIAKYSKEVGESMMKQVNAEFDKMRSGKK